MYIKYIDKFWQNEPYLLFINISYKRVCVFKGKIYINIYLIKGKIYE